MTIFSNPSPGDYASAGASIAGSWTVADLTARLGAISVDPADQPQIRYTADGYYELKLPGRAWDRLVHDKGLGNPDSSNNSFTLQGVPYTVDTPSVFFIISMSRNRGYTYSEMAVWSGAGRYGELAFGVPTPAGGVPMTGTATFSGQIEGHSDIIGFEGGLCGCSYLTPVEGGVTLNFDFAAGTLAGSISPVLNDYVNPTLNLGTFAFKNTLYSAGSTTYSGNFVTAAGGQNFFSGRFTGPNAQETIGAWALPFVYNTSGAGYTADGQDHQAFGAWIAKRP